MHVAILVKEFPPDVIGGTETQTMRMAAELEERTAHNVTVYTKAYSGHDPHDPEYDLVRIPNWRINSFVSTLTFVLVASFYLLRDHRKIDILQCMMIYPNGFIGYIVSKFTGLAYFAWIRGGDYYFMKENRIKRWSINRVLVDTLVLVQAEAVQKDVLSEFPHAALQVLGNGVTIPDERADGDRVVFAGRLKQQKGVDVLIRSMADIDRELLIVGDGPERCHLEKLAKKLNVDVEFTGEVPPDEVDEYLTQGCIFVLPSVRGEGLPNAVLEAMAVGLPVIGTDTAGVRNVIQDGTTGYVVEPNNVKLLQKRIRLLATDTRRREQMGTAAREYIQQHYSWKVIIQELDGIYNTVTSNQ